ncbi:phosphatase PAP2 family protein [Halopenitus sp. POP-27]|uniref:phosphatase PAP2 family protein n=1 Tax=Halopenitus sp. POP-27 TaxID=2994425 RepID=UPI0024694122|nr:phosphatase PAP2 family protein [Halopenitus sp. POP-27]
MSVLLSVLTYLAAIVASTCLIVGMAILDRRRIYRIGTNAGPYLWSARRQLAGLVAVLLVSSVGRSGLQAVSEVYGWRATGTIFALEDGFVAWVQGTLMSPYATLYFSWIYIYAYAFLLVFPVLIYLGRSTSTTFKRLIVAYTLNYGIGLIVYTIVFAHGPRNVDLVSGLLFTFNPDFQELAARVNENANVFPSLHTSLSMTVAAFAYRTREAFPAWTVLSGWLAVSVWIATMYLGIHWLIDVLGGIVLALGCVAASVRIVDPDDRDGADDAEGSAERTDP